MDLLKLKLRLISGFDSDLLPILAPTPTLRPDFEKKARASGSGSETLLCIES